MAESGFWEDGFLNYFSRVDRRILDGKINKKIKYHKEGNDVDTYVYNQNEDSSNREYDYSMLSASDFAPDGYSGR